MAEILKVTVNWTGFIGAPGYSNMYVRDFGGSGVDQAVLDGFITKLDAFLDAWVGFIPTNVSYVINPTAEIIEETTGQLTGYLTGTPDTVRVGTSGGTYSAPAGAVVNWYTSFVRNGRRLKGKTFMVPLAGTAYQADGSIDGTKLASMRTAATALTSATGAGDLGVWGRPTSPGASDGVWAAATSATVPDMVAVLRSRRD